MSCALFARPSGGLPYRLSGSEEMGCWANEPRLMSSFSHMRLRKHTPAPRAEQRPIEGTKRLGEQARAVIQRLPQSSRGNAAG